jgi:hypothetical protein
MELLAAGVVDHPAARSIRVIGVSKSRHELPKSPEEREVIVLARVETYVLRSFGIGNRVCDQPSTIHQMPTSGNRAARAFWTARLR